MASFDDFQPMTTHRIQLLKLAQEVLFHEYIDKKAQMHNQWSADADVAWRTRGVKLPYPSFPPYPDNSMIIAKAMEMEKFLNSGLEKSKEQNQETVKIDTQHPVANIKEPTTKEVQPEVVEVKTERVSVVPEILEKNDYFTGIGNTEPTQNNQSLFSGFFSRK